MAFRVAFIVYSESVELTFRHWIDNCASATVHVLTFIYFYCFIDSLLNFLLNQVKSFLLCPFPTLTLLQVLLPVHVRQQSTSSNCFLITKATFFSNQYNLNLM